jgi:hypothetical protein
MSCRLTSHRGLLLALGLAFPAAAFASTTVTQATPDKPPPGYHDQTVYAGGKPMTIRVPDEKKNTLDDSALSDGHYDPSNVNMNRTSSYANKSFSTGEAAMGGDDTAAEAHDQKRFATSTYAASAYNQANKTFETAAYKGSAQNSGEFAKAFKLPGTGTATEANQSYAVSSSDLQSKKALIADNPKNKIDPFATTWSEGDKRFYDPTMLRVPHKKHDFHIDANKANPDNITNLPNRPLSVDEVRNLINNDQTPDLDEPPDAPSKPLNDPDWAPAVKAPLLDDKKVAPATPPPDEAGDGELPSPGMMAKPDSNPPPSK